MKSSRPTPKGSSKKGRSGLEDDKSDESDLPTKTPSKGSRPTAKSSAKRNRAEAEFDEQAEDRDAKPSPSPLGKKQKKETNGFVIKKDPGYPDFDLDDLNEV